MFNKIEDEIFKEIDDLDNDLHREEQEGKAKIDAEIAAIKRERLADIEDRLKKGKNSKDFQKLLDEYAFAEKEIEDMLKWEWMK